MAVFIKPVNADEIIKAVRADEIVGIGTCSPIDETFTDDELLQYLCYEDFDGGTNHKCTVEKAICETRAYHQRWEEHRQSGW